MALGRYLKHPGLFCHRRDPVAQRAVGMCGDTPLKEAHRLLARQIFRLPLAGQVLPPARLAAEMFVDHHEVELLAECIDRG
jgi:hypothetical protein